VRLEHERLAYIIGSGVRIAPCKSKDCENFEAAIHTAISRTYLGKPSNEPNSCFADSVNAGVATSRSGALPYSWAKRGGSHGPPQRHTWIRPIVVQHALNLKHAFLKGNMLCS
jgi:hypothetical protein